MSNFMTRSISVVPGPGSGLEHRVQTSRCEVAPCPLSGGAPRLSGAATRHHWPGSQALAGFTNSHAHRSRTNSSVLFIGVSPPSRARPGHSGRPQLVWTAASPVKDHSFYHTYLQISSWPTETQTPPLQVFPDDLQRLSLPYVLLLLLSLYWNYLFT